MIEIQKEIKIKFKKALPSVVLAVSLIAANILPVQIADNTLAFADEKPKEIQNINNTIVQQGNCGENVVWKLDTEGQLTISGTGDMSEWGNSDNSKDNQEPPWNNLKEKITVVIIENGVTSVSAEAFFGCSKVKKIVLGNDVSKVGNKAFADCESLQNIEVNNNENSYFYSYDGCLYKKDTWSLYACPAGKRQVLLLSIDSIHTGAFWGCHKLKEIKLPENFLEEIGSYAFYQCDALTKIVIPKKVTEIKEYTFAGCSALTEFEVSETMENIDTTAFSGCGKLNICGLKDSYAQQYAQQTNLPFKEISYWNGGVIAINPWNGRIDTSWYTEEKTEFFISTPQQLAGLAELVNKGNMFEGKVLRLTNDIFLNDRMKSTEYEWVPIAYSADKEDTGLVFQGTFDGGGYHIYNLYTSNKGQGGGLFGRIGEKGVVKAVTISQGYLNYGGSIANNNDGWILFCNNDSMTEVYGKESHYLGSCGGICNFNSNLVYGCKNYGYVCGDYPAYEASGIVGMNTVTIATVSECSNIGIVKGNDIATGIVAYNHGWIQNCYNTGEIIAGRYAAGITYYNYNGIGNCYFAGNLYIGVEYGNRGAIYEEDMTPAKKPQNCYAAAADYYCDSPTMLIYEEMTSAEFANKLNRQAYTACFGWYSDEYGINNGFPINSADYSAYQKKYKMAPEIWVNRTEPKAEGKAGMTITIGYPYSYAEKIPSITVDNPEIAEVANQSTTESIKAVLELKKVGTTQVTIAFSETENNRATEYKIDLTVEGRKIIYGDTNGDGDVNSKDAVLLKKHLAGYTGLDIDIEAADVNSDGKIDSKDAVRLLRYLAGYEVKLEE